MTLDDFRPDESGDDSARFDPAEPRRARRDLRWAYGLGTLAVIGVVVLSFTLSLL